MPEEEWVKKSGKTGDVIYGRPQGFVPFWQYVTMKCYIFGGTIVQWDVGAIVQQQQPS